MGNETDESKAAENAEETKSEETTDEAAQESGEGLTDKHGQEAVAKGKYEREIKARDAKIAELQAKVDEAAKTEENRKALQAEIDKLRAEASEKDTDHALELAGCVNLKAAKAVLADYDGEVEKLKEACPYLFQQQEKKGATGLKPGGAAKEDEDAELDRAFGLKK